MTDMLVKLYQLPPLADALAYPQSKGITIRRGLVPEKHHVLAWVGYHFSEYWVSECEIAFTRQPPSIFVATAPDNHLIGFACYDSTQRGFFGPMGVSEQIRGMGVGAALLVAALHDMHTVGYGYAIIGAVGPVDFYNKIVGAVTISNSDPGVYAGMLRTNGIATQEMIGLGSEESEGDDA